MVTQNVFYQLVEYDNQIRFLQRKQASRYRTVWPWRFLFSLTLSCFIIGIRQPANSVNKVPPLGGKLTNRVRISPWSHAFRAFWRRSTELSPSRNLGKETGPIDVISCSFAASTSACAVLWKSQRESKVFYIFLNENQILCKSLDVVVFFLALPRYVDMLLRPLGLQVRWKGWFLVATSAKVLILARGRRESDSKITCLYHRFWVGTTSVSTTC